MINEEIREFLAEHSPESVIFDDPAYDNSIVGISTDGCLVYDFAKMVKELSQDDGISEEEALDFIEYNTVRILPYIATSRPIIVDFDIDELYTISREER